MILPLVTAFLVGGALCAVAQLVVDLTSAKFTPAHVMVLFVSLGAVASAIGLYGLLVRVGGAGALIPLTGFGHALVRGAILEGSRTGPLGLFTGALSATALGLTTAIVFGWLMAVTFRPKG